MADRAHSTLIFGLGATGMSCVEHLARRETVAVVDTRARPPGAARLAQAFPDVRRLTPAEALVRLGDFDRIVVSPGIALEHCLVADARRAGLEITSDIGIFLDEADAPVTGITGTNGKSTVTTLVGELMGDDVGIGGNLGVPALALLAKPRSRYVLELSSFQLERLQGGRFDVASILNVTPDHLDRYGSFDDYAASKRLIYRDYRTAVFDSGDPLTVPPSPARGIDVAADAEWRLERDALWVGGRRVALDGLPLRGRHNAKNMLMAAAIAFLGGTSGDDIVGRLASCRGLPHRCALVGHHAGVEFINDSKATNVGATLAALDGLGDPARRHVVLIAGGDAKGAEFDELARVAEHTVRHAVLLGRDAGRIAEALAGRVTTVRVDDMPGAVAAACAVASPGDVVLLSPACASLDMYKSFEARGDAFERAVADVARG